MKHKTLCIYVFHIYNERVKYFIENAIYKDESIDFLIVANDPSITIKDIKLPEFCNFMNRENLGYDFGAWSYGILKDNLYKSYSYFMFVNSSVMGPYTKHKNNWIDLFTSKLSNNIKLYGCTINTIKNPLLYSHVQSYLFTLDINTLEYLIKNDIFSLEKYAKTFDEAILNYEIRMSRLIIENGWNIGCRMNIFNEVDFTFKTEQTINKYLFYDDMMYSEYENDVWKREEIIFVKGNRIKCPLS